jgi:DNA replication protein DnaC
MKRKRRLKMNTVKEIIRLFNSGLSNRSIAVSCNISPVDKWHEVIGEPTIADAILDRIVHNAYHIKLTGESMRKNITKNLN